MKRQFAKLLAPIAFALILGFAFSADAATVTANSCSQSDVQAAITSAGRSGTVDVPAGSCTWGSGVTITTGLTLIGAGQGSTIITASASGVVFVTASPDATAISGGENITIKGFTWNLNSVDTIAFDLNGASGITGTQAYCCYIIAYNTFENMEPGTSDGVITAANANGNGQLRGVIAQNIFNDDDIILRIFSNDDTGESGNSAFTNVALGQSDQLFFEANTIEWTSSYTGGNPGWTETGQGARLVERYNTWNFANVSGMTELNDVHGFQNWTGAAGSGQTGTMLTERYGNTYTGFEGYRALNFRGGVGITFDNLITGTGSGPSWQLYGESTTNFCPSSISPTPTNYNPLAIIYSWNNTWNGTENPLSSGYSGSFGCTIAQNNGAALGTVGSASQGSWWVLDTTDCTASSCTAGIGEGTTAPTGTCTLGVGYWVASTPTPTTSSAIIQNASFYQCTATNTWTLYYKPFTYPHPLRSSTPSPSPATNLIATPVQQ